MIAAAQGGLLDTKAGLRDPQDALTQPRFRPLDHICSGSKYSLHFRLVTPPNPPLERKVTVVAVVAVSADDGKSGRRRISQKRANLKMLTRGEED